MSVARAAFAWPLTEPCRASVIIGAKNRGPLLDELAAAQVPLARERVKRLDDAGALPSGYPG